jgi:hypothetical protein
MILSARLLSRIEQNCEKIARGVYDQSRRDEHTCHYAALDEEEIRRRAKDVVRNLNDWIRGEIGEEELRERYRQLGARRRSERFPLEEVVYMLQTIEWQIVQYVQNDNPPVSTLDVYGELEVLRALHRFFGIVVHSTVSGYERSREERTAVAA